MQRPLTLDAELCDICWGWAIPDGTRAAKVFGDVVDVLDEVDDIRDAIEWGRHKGLTGHGFPSLVQAVWLLDASSVDPDWVREQRDGYVAEHRAAYRGRLEEERSAAARRTGGGPEGILQVPEEHVNTALQGTPDEGLPAASLWWDPESTWPGYVARGPIRALERLGRDLARGAGAFGETVTWTELRTGDTPDVEETARGLHRSGQAIRTLEQAFEAARAVHT